MKTMYFSEAIDDALGQGMAEDERIIILGEDVPLLRRRLLVRFGLQRVWAAPISESAFLGAGVAAAMAGLHPVVELYMVDFITVAIDALVNHAAKLETFSGGKWQAPIVIRAPCGGGYGDGGQHEQTLWGWLAHIPGLAVVVPSNPADAGALMLGALKHNGPVVFLEHKLFSETWLEFLGSGGRNDIHFDIPEEGRRGRVPETWKPAPIGSARVLSEGSDITLVSVGRGVHQAITASRELQSQGISSTVIDLRSLAPLDKATVFQAVENTGRLLVIDEDYEGFGLSGELAAILLEAGIRFQFSRVCTQTNIPYARHLEDQVLPNHDRICAAVVNLMGK